MNELDNKRRSEGKLTIDELVVVGDALHDCTASFILMKNNAELDEFIDVNDYSFVCHGTKESLILLFQRIFEHDKVYMQIVLEAIVRNGIEKITHNNENR